MTRPELARRVERVEQDLTAISDTVLDIKDTVDRHTAELAVIKRTQGRHTQVLDQHTQVLDQHTQVLDQHTHVLDQHTVLLNEILRRLDAR